MNKLTPYTRMRFLYPSAAYLQQSFLRMKMAFNIRTIKFPVAMSVFFITEWMSINSSAQCNYGC